MKVRCKVNCFHSQTLERFDENHVYDIDDKKFKEFEKIDFAKYFEVLSPAVVAASKKEAAK